MRLMLISIWGPRMQEALRMYFRDHDVRDPDPGDVACLTTIGVTEIDRRNMGFKSTSFLGMASLLVPAILDPNHILHGEIRAAVQACKDQLGAAAMATRARTTGLKPRGALAETVKLGPTAKLPRLGKRAEAHAKFAKTKAVPKRIKATPTKRRPK
jgi:hypothetical protein